MKTITVNIPTQLKKLIGDVETITVSSDTILGVVNDLNIRFPGVKERLVNSETGRLNKFVLFFVNDEDIRFIQNENTLLKDGDIVNIVPALAGG